MLRANPYFVKIKDYPEFIIDNEQVEQMEGNPIFANPAPLVLDLGCGAGNFLAACATLLPDFNYIGVDLRYKRLVYAARKLAKRKLVNVKLLRQNIVNLPNIFEANTVSAVYINFPDPWPKRRQQKNRYLSADFCLSLKKMLLKSGKVHLKTDDQGYFEYAAKQLGEFFEIKMDHPNQASSEFEELFIGQNKQIFQLTAENNW